MIELIIVISIIAILASMLLPALKQAKDTAKKVSCANQLKQLGIAIMFYSNDNKGYLPPHSAASQKPNWKTLIADDLNVKLTKWYGENSVFCCPADLTGISSSRLLYKATHIGKSSYACNLHVMDLGYADGDGDGDIGPMHTSKIRDASDTIMLMEAQNASNSIGWCNFDAGATYKGGKSFSYPDNFTIGAITGYHPPTGNNWLFCDTSVRAMLFNDTLAPEKNLWKVRTKHNNVFGP